MARDTTAANPRKPAARKKMLAREIKRLVCHPDPPDPKYLARVAETKKHFEELLGVFRDSIQMDNEIARPVRPKKGGEKRCPLAERSGQTQPDPFLVDALAFHLAIYETWTPANQDAFEFVCRDQRLRRLLKKLPEPYLALRPNAVFEETSLKLFGWMFPFALDQWVRFPFVHNCRMGGKPGPSVGYFTLTLDAFGISDLFESFSWLLAAAMKQAGINGRARRTAALRLDRLRAGLERAFADASGPMRRDALLLRLDQLLQDRRKWMTKTARMAVLARLMSKVGELKKNGDGPRCVEKRLAEIEREFEEYESLELFQEPQRCRADSDFWRLNLA